MEHTKLIKDKKFIFLSLDKNERSPSLQVMESIGTWSVRAHDDNKLQKTVDAIPKPRWYLFSNFRVISANQFSSHFITLVLRRACCNFQQLLWIENYNWEICQDKIVAIMKVKMKIMNLLKTMNIISPRKYSSKIYLLFVRFKNRFNIITYWPSIDISGWD